MNDIRTTDINLTVDQLRTLREAVTTLIDASQDDLHEIPTDDALFAERTAYISELQELRFKLCMEIEKVVGL